MLTLPLAVVAVNVPPRAPTAPLDSDRVTSLPLIRLPNSSSTFTMGAGTSAVLVAPLAEGLEIINLAGAPGVTIRLEESPDAFFASAFNE